MARYALALILVCSATSVSADVVCRSRSGRLALRETCAKRETVVPPSALGIAGRLVVKDSNGALVGFVIGPTFNPPFTVPDNLVDDRVTPVVRLIEDTWVQFRVDARGSLGFDTPLGDSFEYESTDCTGNPLVIVGASAMMSMAFVGPDGTETYAILPGTPRMFHSNAFFPPAGETCSSTTLPNGMCCRTNIQTSPVKNLANTMALNLSTLGLVPPFHVESE